MNLIQNYMREHNLDDEAMAALMTEKTGRSYKASTVRTIRSKRDVPNTWLNALGISPKEPSNLKSGVRASGVPGASSAPQPGGAIAPTIDLPFEITSARVTIEMLYTMIGKGAAMGSRTPQVATLWEQSAPGLAESWLEWAKENRTVANGIAMLTIGGPGGQVILLNASLLISTLMAIQQANGIEIIPRQFVPPHERPEGDEEKIRENTDAAVDDALGNTQG